MSLELVLQSMNKLKTILLYNSGNYLHLALWILGFLYALRAPFLWVPLSLYTLMIYHQQKELVYISLFILSLIGLRALYLNQTKHIHMPYKAMVVQVEADKIYLQGQGKSLIYLDHTEAYKPGMILMIYGHVLENDDRHMENQFSYETYLKAKGIKYRMTADHIEIIEEGFHLNMIPYQVGRYIDQHFSKSVSSYIHMFILGNQSYMDDGLSQESRDIGISHLFAISGMHLGLIVLVVNRLLNRLYLRRHIHLIILASFLMFYNLLTGYAISIVRASLAFFLIFACDIYYIKISKADIIGLIMVIMMVYNPYVIDDISFQLSFLMVTVILLLYPLIKKKSYIKQTYIVSTMAFLYGLPIILSMNHRIGLLNILYSPIFIVYVSLILLPMTILIFFIPYMQGIYGWIIYIFEYAIEGAHRLNIYLRFGFINTLFIFIYWLLLTVSVYKIFTGRIKILKMTMVWLFFGLMLGFNQTFSLTSKVIILDVNQGDSIYIQDKDCRLLIDTGKTDAHDTLIHYFIDKNIFSLDGLILTHQHADHIGEAQDLLAALDIGRVYTNKVNKRLPLSKQKVLGEGDTIRCGQIKLNVLHGDEGYDNENNNSLVIFSRIKSENWLFTGDIEEIVELKLIERYHFHVDHLKIAHHGSKTSSSLDFIHHFKPKHVYISVGINDYQMPNEEVLKRYQTFGSLIYTTQDFGSLTRFYIGNESYLVTYRNKRKRVLLS